MGARLLPAIGLLTICVAGSISASAAEVELITGKIYPVDAAADKPLFLYENSRTKAGDSVVSSQTRYTDLQGKPVVEEETFYEAGKLKRYRYNQLQTDERGEIEIVGSKANFVFFAQGKRQADEEELEEKIIVPDMIGDVMKDSWNELMAGESIKVRFLLVERLDSIGFKFFKAQEREMGGRTVVDMVMKPSSFFIAAVAPKITLTVEKAPPHRLVETSGRLPVRVSEVDPPKSRKDWRAIDGRLVLDPPKTPEPVKAPETPETAKATGTPKAK